MSKTMLPQATGLSTPTVQDGDFWQQDLMAIGKEPKNLEIGATDIAAGFGGSVLRSGGTAVSEFSLGDTLRGGRAFVDGTAARGLVDTVKGWVGAEGGPVAADGLISLAPGLNPHPVSDAVSEYAGKAADAVEGAADWADNHGVRKVAQAVGGAVKGSGEAIIEHGTSDDYKTALQQRQLYEGDSLSDFRLGDGAGDPAVFAAKFVDGIGSLGGTLGAAALTGGVWKAAVKRSMLKRGASAELAEATAKEAGRLMGQRAAVATGMGMSVGQAGDQTREQVLGLPVDQLMQSETFREHARSVASDPAFQGATATQIIDEAHRRTADTAASVAKSNPATWAAAAAGTMMGDANLFKMLQGAGAKGVAAGMGKGALGEGVGETVEEGSQQYIGNTTTNQIAGQEVVDPMSGVLPAAATAGTIGLASGGGTGAIGGLRGGYAPQEGGEQAAKAGEQDKQREINAKAWDRGIPSKFRQSGQADPEVVDIPDLSAAREQMAGETTPGAFTLAVDQGGYRGVYVDSNGKLAETALYADREGALVAMRQNPTFWTDEQRQEAAQQNAAEIEALRAKRQNNRSWVNGRPGKKPDPAGGPAELPGEQPSKEDPLAEPAFLRHGDTAGRFKGFAEDSEVQRALAGEFGKSVQELVAAQMQSGDLGKTLQERVQAGELGHDPFAGQNFLESMAAGRRLGLPHKDVIFAGDANAKRPGTDLAEPGAFDDQPAGTGPQFRGGERTSWQQGQDGDWIPADGGARAAAGKALPGRTIEGDGREVGSELPFRDVVYGNDNRDAATGQEQASRDKANAEQAARDAQATRRNAPPQIGQSDTIFAGGEPGADSRNSAYTPPRLARDQVDGTLGEQSVRDPRTEAGRAIQQAGSEADSIFGQLKSLRITRKGKPFATEKEAQLASRKTETPIALPTGGFGVVDKTELEQVQASQQPSSNSAQQDRQDGKTEIAQNGMVIVHGSGNPGMSEQDIQIVRASGQKQGKKGRVYGGFYGTSEQDAHQAQAYADMMGGTPTLYDVKIKPGTKVLHKQGDITRLSESYINELVSQGYGVVTGTDPRGQTEHVVIDKSAVASMAPRGTQSTPSQVDEINAADMRQPSSNSGQLHQSEQPLEMAADPASQEVRHGMPSPLPETNTLPQQTRQGRLPPADDLAPGENTAPASDAGVAASGVTTPWTEAVTNADGTVTLKGDVPTIKQWAKDNGVKAMPRRDGMLVSRRDAAKVLPKEPEASAPEQAANFDSPDLADQTQSRSRFTIEPLTDKSIIVKGDKNDAELKDRVEAAWPKAKPLYNEKQKGWVFSNKREGAVREALARLEQAADTATNSEHNSQVETNQDGDLVSRITDSLVNALPHLSVSTDEQIDASAQRLFNTMGRTNVLEGHPEFANRRQDPEAYRKFMDANKLVTQQAVAAAAKARRDASTRNQEPATPKDSIKESELIEQVKPATTGSSSHHVGSKATVHTPSGKPVDVQYGLVEASALTASHDFDGNVNPAFPQQFQPRDRSRVASRQQLFNIAQGPAAVRLGASAETDRGAPIVKGGIVESGNGRVIGLTEAYRRGNATAYKQYLADHAAEYGLTREQVESMQQPVLVRERLTDMTPDERRAFTVDSNKSASLGMGASEQAMADASGMTDAMLSRLNVGEDGNVLGRQNDGFLNDFASMLGNNELADYKDANGFWNGAYRRRVNNAIFARGYGDPRLLSAVSEADDPASKNMLSALMNNASKLATLRALDPEAGATLADYFVNAAGLVSRSRSSKQSIQELSGQSDMLGGGIDPLVSDLAEAIDADMRSGKRIAELLSNITNQLITAAKNLDQVDIFSGKAGNQLTAEEAINGTISARKAAQAKQPRPGGDLFGANPPRLQSRETGGVATDDRQGQGGNRTQELTGKPESKLDKAAQAIKDKKREKAEKLKRLLQERKGTLNAGIDPEVMIAVAELGALSVADGAVRFAQFVRDTLASTRDVGIDDADVKPFLKEAYGAIASNPEKYGVSDEVADNMDMARDYRRLDIDSLLEEQGNNAEHTATDPQADSRHRDDEAQPDRGNLLDDGRGRGRRETAGAGKQASEQGRAAGESMGDRGPHADGKRGDHPVQAAKPGVGDGAAGSADNRRRAANSTGGLLAEQAGGQPAKAVAQQAPVTRPAPASASPGNITSGKLAEIREQLPFLTEGQAQDVVFAEARFSKPDGTGVLFTNGTGTGKTFTGLGAIYRAFHSGKKNILIVAPKQPIVDAWIKAGSKYFNLPIKRLEGMTDNGGEGIVVTTYANLAGNQSLVERNWDMLVMDEAHYLSSDQAGSDTNALKMTRALGQMSGSAYARVDALHPEIIRRIREIPGEIKALSGDENRQYRVNALQDELEQLDQRRSKLIGEEKDRLAKLPSEHRPRGLFLSATPFAYEKSVGWANGFLFDWGNDEGFVGYNSGGAYERFMMQHFGYRMRYNKLTEPEAEVDRGLMQRAFNTWLKREGVLSSRAMDSDFDYDRRFVLTESAIGRRVDEAIEWLRDHGRESDEMAQLHNTLIGDNFDYHARMYFLEAIKAREAIPQIRAHLEMGRNVVVMHDFKQGGVRNPFRITPKDEIAHAYDQFKAEFGDLIRAFSSIPSPIELLSREFPDALVYNGSVSAKKRVEQQELFNSDAEGTPRLIIAQGDAMREGVSIHDTTGQHPRVMIHLGMPVKPTAAIQQEGRIYRTGQKSNAMFRYLTIGTSWERAAFASKIATRASAAENLAMGEEARGLKAAFIQAYEEAGDYTPGHEGEGTGGKASDRAMANNLTPWDMAKSMYFANQKMGKGRGAKGRAQEDYFATPEPVGLKMVQLADIRGGDAVLEPSAGHGAIARWFPENSTNRAIELTNELSSKLALHFDGDLITGRFEDHHIVNKYDAIVMNPPFGHGGKLAAEHVAKAITHLRDGGRIVALIPTGPAADKRFNELLYGDDANPAIHKIAEIAMPGVTFERAGTSVATKILVLEKQANQELAAQLPSVSRDYTGITSTKELFDRMENLELEPRKAEITAEQQYQQRAEQQKERDREQQGKDAELIATSPWEVVKHTTMKGKVISGVIRTDLTREQAEAIDPYTFKKGDGFFIREKHIPAMMASHDGNPSVEVRFSKHSGAPLEQHTTTKELELFVKGWQKRYKGGAGVRILVGDTQADLNEVLQMVGAQPAPKGQQVEAAYLPGYKTLLLNAAAIKNAKHARQILQHEVLAHHGLREVVGDDAYISIIEAVKRGKNIAAIKQAYYDVAQNYSDMHPDVQAEEVFAHWAENQPERGELSLWWRGIVRRVKDALRAVGLLGERTTEDELGRVFDAIVTGMKNGRKPGRRVMEAWNEVPVYSLGDKADPFKPDTKEAENYRTQLAKAMASLRSGEMVMDIGRTPAVLRAVGAPDLTLRISRDTIRKATNGVKHDVPMEVLEQLPELLHDPVAVFDSKTNPGDSLVALLDAKDASGRGVISAIQLKVSGGKYLEINRIASVHGRPDAQLNQWLSDGLAKYIKENHPGSLLTGLQLPLGSSMGGSEAQLGTTQGLQLPKRGSPKRVSDSNILTADDIRNSQALFRLGGATADDHLGSAERKLNLVPPPDVIDRTKARIEALRGADKEQVKSWWQQLIHKANTNMLDGLAPIKYAEEAQGKLDARESGYAAARLATGSSSTMQATLLYGLPEWKDGVIQKKAGTGEADSLLGIFEGLGKDLHSWLGWMAGHRAERLMAEGRENLLTSEEIQALKQQGAGKEAKFDEAKAKWNRLNGATLDLAQEAGLMTKEQRDSLNDEWYIPFFRESEDGDVLAPFKAKGIANQSAGIKKLKGGKANVNDLLENIFTTTGKLIDASMKNMAAQKVVWNLAETDLIEVVPKPNLMDMRASAKPGNQMIWVKMDGEDYLIKVHDADLFRAMTMIDQKRERGPVMQLAMKAKHLLTAGVTSSPEFMLRNFMRDAVSAWAINEDGFTPLIDSIKGVKQTLKMNGGSIDMMFSGATFLGGYVSGNNPEAMASSVRKALRTKGMNPDQIDRYEKSLIRNGKQAWDVLSNVWRKYERVGEAIENGSREAVYSAAIKAGKSHAQAAFEAKDLMDFSMLGSSKVMQFLVDVLPFFNARMQGLGKLGRAMRDNPAQIARRGGMIAAASLALLALNWDDDRYDDLPDWDKDLNWHFFLGDQHFRIPKPFEIGLIFGTLPERMTRAMGGKDTMGKFGQVVARNMLETFAINPIPQVVKPISEAYFNYDPFRGGPIDNMSDLNVLPEARYDERTSLLMRELGELTGWSPKKLQHIAEGYTGTMGAYVLAAGDALTRAFGNYGSKPSFRADEIPLLRTVYQGSAPARSSQAMTDFYKLLEQVNSLQATINRYRKEGRYEDATELLQENRQALAGRQQLNAAQKQFRALRNEMQLIMRDRTLTAEGKRERIDRLLARRNNLASQMIHRFEMQ